jgi:signal transduction histidine kinase
MKSRDWAAAAAIALAVVAVGLAELTRIGAASPGSGVLFVLLVAGAVGAARWAPGPALGVAWTAGFVQLLGGVPILLAEVSLAVVLFAAARWGRTLTVFAAAVSVGLIPGLALLWLRTGTIDTGLAGRVLIRVLTSAGPPPLRLWGLLLPLGILLLGLPFLAGLALRFLSRAQTAQAARQVAERDAHQAHEIARLREAQNRLARDVHDVVGHSLTVILAQAESAQFIEDPDRLKQTMQTIAASARTSLQDVRQVLTPGPEPAAARPGGLDELVETVRASGHPVVATEVGEVRPLPPELETVAYRVLQELLTNAIKHGRRDRTVLVERHWPERSSGDRMLRILVRNAVDVSATVELAARDTAAADSGPGGAVGGGAVGGGGQGIPGMRRRLESVGGWLDVSRSDRPDDPSFTAVAFVPVRPPSAGETA